jgi:hypothetical protein
MTLYEEIIKTYPELTESDFAYKGSIVLQNDGDEIGDYIKEWNYSKAIPKGLKLGK